MELCSMLCGKLYGRGFSRRLDACICMAKSLHSPPEAITTLLIGHTTIQNKKLNQKKKREREREPTGNWQKDSQTTKDERKIHVESDKKER